jgi:hypothetical protein
MLRLHNFLAILPTIAELPRVRFTHKVSAPILNPTEFRTEVTQESILERSLPSLSVAFCFNSW